MQIGVKQRRVETDGAPGMQRPCSSIPLAKIAIAIVTAGYVKTADWFKSCRPDYLRRLVLQVLRKLQQKAPPG
jgi:hypothetical protein